MSNDNDFTPSNIHGIGDTNNNINNIDNMDNIDAKQMYILQTLIMIIVM